MKLFAQTIHARMEELALRMAQTLLVIVAVITMALVVTKVRA